MLNLLWLYATDPVVIFTCIVIVFVIDGFFKAFFISFGMGLVFYTGIVDVGFTSHVGNVMSIRIFVILLVTFTETFIAYFFKKNYFLLVQSD